MPPAQAQAAACPSGTPYSTAVLGTTGLAGYWRLDDSTALTVCDALNVNPGTYTSGATVLQTGALAGESDTAARFNGSSGKVSVPSATSLNTANTFSIEAWVKRATTGSAQVIATKQSNAWTLLFNTSNQLVLQSNTTNIAVSTTTVTDTTTWHHVAATKNGTAVKLYIDGKDVTPTTTTNATMANNTLAVLIGAGASSSFFNGTIDEVALYKTVLSPAQVTNHFLLAKAACPVTGGAYATAVAQTTNLVAYWRLDDRTGTTACDSSGRYPGTFAGTVSLAQAGAIAGDSNTAVRFDGASANVSVPALPVLDVGDTVSIEAWVKRGSIGGAVNQVVAAKQSQSWMLMFNQSNKLVLGQAGVGDIAASTSTVADTTTWHHVAATKTGSAVHLYIDGSDVTGTVTNRTLANNTQPIAIGQSGATAYFKGTIDEVAVYRSALTASQISNHWSLAQPVPTAPSALSATVVSSSRIDLAWADNSSNETGFVVERSTDSSFTAPQTTTLPAGATSWSATGLSAATPYWYRVKAVNGAVSSAFSNTATATTSPAAPAAPSALAATAASSSQIELAWADNSSNETGFVVERSTDASFTAPEATAVPANATTWSDTGLNASTAYWYRVKAVNGTASSAFSNTATATTSQPPPTAPSGLEATSISGSRINLAWKDNSSDETGFVVERSTDSSFTAPQAMSLSANATSFSDTGVSSGTDYWYRAKAINGGGGSQFAQTASKLTTAAASSAGSCDPDVSPWTNPPLSPARFNCVGHRQMRSRGWIKEQCLTTPQLLGEIYPEDNWCGKDLEALAQARAIQKARDSDPSARDRTHWEVVTATPGRADITFETASSLQVYEVKRVKYWESRLNPAEQVENYVDAMNAVGVSPTARRGSATAGVFAGWADMFLAPDKSKPTCVASNGERAWQFKAYFTWMVASGVLAVFEEDVPCFDPVSEPPKVPVPSPSTNPVPDDGQPVPKPDGGPPDGAIVMPPSGAGDSAWPTPDVSLLPPPVGGPTGPTPVTTPSPSPSGSSGGGAGGTGGASGDPHLVTFDGLAYDFQATGEFEMAESDALGLDVQARLHPLGTTSVIESLAFDLNGYKVEFNNGGSPSLLIDGAVTSLPSGMMFDLGDGAFLVHDTAGYTAVWPGAGQRPELHTDGRQSMTLSVPLGSKVRGLLGNADGLSGNDLVTGSGTQLPATASTAVIHGTFADSWRIADDESLFTYAPGQSTETFTDRSFPPSILKVQDFDDATLAEGTAQCTNAGVVDGRQFDDCVIDWAVTRDSAFLDSAAARVDPVTEGGARMTGIDGTVREDFEAGVAPNFSAARYGSGTGTGTFAGPFSHDGRYVFYVPETPAHLNATITLDVITLGNWTYLDNNQVTLTVNGQPAWTGNIAAGPPSATGTTPSGQPYAVYPVTVTVPHSADQLNVGVSSDLAPAAARAFAVDNINVRFDLVPPQVFNVSLPASMSDGVPAAGAGNLETQVSEDVYAFSTPTKKSFRVEFWDCSPALVWSQNLVWKLVDTGSGATVKSGYGCAPNTVADLPAGSYQVKVTSRGNTGTYKLRLAPRDVTPISLPASISDGVPVTGAGRLETPAVEDVYSFSTTTAKSVQFEFSQCQPALQWQLVNADTGVEVKSLRNTCTGVLISDLPAGNYELAVSSWSGIGTYKLDVYEQPVPQVFDVGLPAMISDGVPAVGAGNLETQVSEDVYGFSTTSQKSFRVEFWGCSSALAWSQNLVWNLVDSGSGATVKTGYGCNPTATTVPDLPAGSYRLKVTAPGNFGTYKLRLAPRDVTSISLPASISDGVPVAGAGRLETPAVEDVYSFSTTSAKSWRFEFSQCQPSLQWQLVNADTGVEVKSVRNTCVGTVVSDLPAGDYELSVSSWNGTGTYKLDVYEQPPPQVFDVNLPALISDGVPAAGAGNLETQVSEDVYAFSTTSQKSFRVEFWGCSSALAFSQNLAWKLVDTGSGATVNSGYGCNPTATTVPDLPAGSYQLKVTGPGNTGTYKLRLAPREVVPISLPAHISDGVPATGAGRLDTPAAEDAYSFSTTVAKTWQFEFSQCQLPLQWQIVNADTRVEVRSVRNTCAGTLVDLPAGNYELNVSPWNGTGTYKLDVYEQPAPQVFDLGLPATISDGVPAAGAGNLETQVSEDVYAFSTSSRKSFRVEFWSCTSRLGGSLRPTWKLVDTASGATVQTGSGCAPNTLADLPAGSYRLRVTSPGDTGTYSLRLAQREVVPISLPASISDGVPVAGAGRIDTFASEDVYSFSTASAGSVQLNFSQCQATLQWQLVNADTGVEVTSVRNTCSGTLVNSLPAGNYQLLVTPWNGTGTYKLDVYTP